MLLCLIYGFGDLWVTGDFSLDCVGVTVQVKTRLKWGEAGVGGEEIHSRDNCCPKFGCDGKEKREMGIMGIFFSFFKDRKDLDLFRCYWEGGS